MQKTATKGAVSFVSEYLRRDQQKVVEAYRLDDPEVVRGQITAWGEAMAAARCNRAEGQINAEKADWGAKEVARDGVMTAAVLSTQTPFVMLYADRILARKDRVVPLHLVQNSKPMLDLALRERMDGNGNWVIGGMQARYFWEDLHNKNLFP